MADLLGTWFDAWSELFDEVCHAPDLFVNSGDRVAGREAEGSLRRDFRDRLCRNCSTIHGGAFGPEGQIYVWRGG